MSRMELKESLKQLVFDKTALKQQVFNNTKEAFELFRSTADRLIKLFQEQAHNEGRTILFEFKDHGDFEFEVRFGGDVLVFCMHRRTLLFSVRGIQRSEFVISAAINTPDVVYGCSQYQPSFICFARNMFLKNAIINAMEA